MINIIVGVLIGITNETIWGILFISIFWGIIAYGYKKFSGHDKEFITQLKQSHPNKKHPKLNFFFIEFCSSASTVFLLGFLIHLVKRMLH